MKMGLLGAIAILILSMNAFASDDCETEYNKYVADVKALRQLSDTDRSKFVEQLEKALQFCKEGKNKEAEKIVKDLKGKADLKEVFSTYDSP